MSGTSVFKRYLGPDAEARLQRELVGIDAAGRAVPTPRVLSVDRVERVVEFAHVDGHPGQALIEAGLATAVLRTTGRTLAALHSRSAAPVTHGDYGPQNILLDAAGEAILLVADWEFSTMGSRPIADLAWAEWIVRMHHPSETASIEAMFDGYGETPPWDDRKRVMLERCEELRLRCHAAGDAAAEQMWAVRVSATSAWDGRGPSDPRGPSG
jgi:tRNA A-37 threonylcarbamoyl transferase component Bud32